MGNMTGVFGLLFIASLLCLVTSDAWSEKNVRKSSLILEYNWPEPSKSLERLPHPKSCHHFIHTKRDGSHIVKRCHGDKVFDYRSLRCQNKWSAKCWINIVKKGNIKKNKLPFSCPFPWGLYPDKEDCTVFYECMGGKVHTRKCPESTLFDVVERICVHSRKALCAGDSSDNTNYRTTSYPKKSRTNRNSFITIDSRQRTSEEENSSEEDDKRYPTKYKDNSFTSRPSFKSTNSVNSKKFRTTEINFKKDSSEENDSSEEKVRTKSQNKYITTKISFPSTGSVNPKFYRTTDSASKKDSSEEDDSSKEKARTISQNKFITSKIYFPSTNTANPKSYSRTINFDSEESSSEENSSEEKDNRISSRHEFKFTTSIIGHSSDDKQNKRSTKGEIPPTTVVFTEKQHLTSSSESGQSSVSLLKISTVKPLISTENKLDKDTAVSEVDDKDISTRRDEEKTFRSTKVIPIEMTTSAKLINDDELKSSVITVTPEVSLKDGDSDDTSKIMPHFTDTVSAEVTSSSKLFSHNILESTSKIPVEFGSTIMNLQTTENTEIEAGSTFNTLCPNPNGHFPHPKNENLFVICSGGIPTIMKCPENLVFDSKIESCNYKRINDR